jgi:hypothetical protein
MWKPPEPFEAISSDDLVDKLVYHADNPWAEWRKGKPITQRQLASFLGVFHIFPDRVYIDGDGKIDTKDGKRVRGYTRAQFEDAWSRYL